MSPRGQAMITDEKITIYQRFGGDIDGWVRAATQHERALMTDEDWADISEILLRLAIVKSGQAADVYDAETKRIIAAKVENEGVAKRLHDCA
jgi:hypothetical protein